MPTPKPDQFGRYRVVTDTGAKISIARQPLPSETVINEPASDIGGAALDVEYLPAAAEPEPTGYEAKKKADLEQEIASRNQGRDEADLIVPAEPGNKPDLIAALEADDLKENHDG